MLIYILKQLIEQISQWLVARDQGAVLLECLLRSANGGSVAMRVGLLQPSASPRQLLELIKLHLEVLKLKGEVDRVELRAAVVGRLGQRQGELFADRWPTDPHQLAMLVNRLSSRLGHNHVLRADPRASPVPERRVKWVPVMEQATNNNERVARGKVSRTSNRRSRTAIPLLLYPTPQAADVMCVTPHGPPQAVWLAGRREPVLACVGPERIETLWWRGASVRRDYYRVATESGQHLWMFQRLPDGAWFMHGIFA
jgi:protein ImuB